MRHAPWTAWLLATLGTFAVLEHRAFTRDSFPTLSETLHAWSRHSGHTLPVAFMAFWTGLVVHVVLYEKKVKEP